MGKFYVAYGSNLSVAQMAVRCPTAKVVGTGILHGWRLLFKGCATIERAEGYETPVLVWDIGEGDEKALDRYEGFPSFYYKEDVDVAMDGEIAGFKAGLKAMVYIMDGRHRCGMPSPYYYEVLRQGYEDFGFDMDILEKALKESVGKTSAEDFLRKREEYEISRS